MEHQGFTGGVAHGGLTMDYEIKILICYILCAVGKKMSFTEINFILQSEGYVNYFEYAKSISELLNLGNIARETDENGEQIFSITSLGEAAARIFEKNIPFTIREKSVKLAKEHLLQKRHERENKAQIEKVDDGYRLSLKLSDIGSDLANISLFVPTLKDCEEIKVRFLKDPSKLYRGVIALLTEDNQTVKELLSDIE